MDGFLGTSDNASVKGKMVASHYKGIKQKPPSLLPNQMMKAKHKKERKKSDLGPASEVKIVKRIASHAAVN